MFVQERPCDGFNPFVNAVNQPIGRPRRNMVAHAPNVKNARSHSQNWSIRFDNI